MKDLETLYETCEFLEKDLREMNDKIRANNGKLTNDSLAYIDKLTHAIKSIKTIIAMSEAYDDSSERGYTRGGMSYRGGRSNAGRSNNSYDGGSYEGRSYGGSYEGGSYEGGMSNARGRGSNAKRDSMGRYSRDDAREDMVMQLRDLMQDADPSMRGEFQTFISKLERM